MSLVSAILLLAADKLDPDAGHWRWNDGSREDSETDRDLFMAICGAAAELGKHSAAYYAVTAVRRHIGQPWGPWNNAKGRTVEQVIAALRETAADLDKQAAA